MSTNDLSRRVFLGGTLAALAACKDKRPPSGAPKEGDIALPPPSTTSTEMPKRRLGKTGVDISIVGLGGSHIGVQKEEAESIRIIRSAIDRGITFMDNAWDYNEGRSEERMGKALQDGYRNKVVLMTKLDGRTRESATRQLEQSLRRLKTDVIDLVQIHEVIRPEDPEACFRASGCVEALVAARAAGKLRFIGFTGHKDPSIHLSMLKTADAAGFVFDAIQMPLNVMDAHYRSFAKEVLPVAVQKGMGVVSMKPIGSGIILESKTVTAVECLHYAMSLPTNCVITGCDSMGVLEQAIDAAIRFQPLTPDAVASLLARTKDAARDGVYEKFKTSQKFDSTAKHPEWLG